MGLGAPRHVESSQTRDRTSVPCIARQILKNYTTREAQVPLYNGHFLDSWYLGIFESRWEEQRVKEDGTGWGRLCEQLWGCEEVRLDLQEAEWTSVFLPGCGRCPQNPLMPCCWIGDYSQDIMVLSDVWIWGSSIPGALWTLSVPSLRVSSPLRSF